MSLRRDIHDAFDDIAPPLGGMPERVVQTVLSNTKRRKREMLTFRARVPLPLVAAFVVVALVAAALIGNQLIQAWVAGRAPSPASQIHLSALQQLEARPMKQPSSSTSFVCAGNQHNADGSFGSGPIYIGSAATTRTTWGYFVYAAALTDAGISGPILIRARDLYAGRPIAFAGAYASGPTVAREIVDGQTYNLRSELVVDETRYNAVTLPGWYTFHNRFVWDFLVGIPAGGSALQGWQIDAAGFSETFFVC